MTSCLKNVFDCLSKPFVNQIKKERLKKEKEMENASKDSSLTEKSSGKELNDSNSKASLRKDAKKIGDEDGFLDGVDQPIKGAITPDVIAVLKPKGHEVRTIDTTGIANAAPRAVKEDMKVGARVEGCLVNGPQYLPQFVDEKNEEFGINFYKTVEKGFLMKTKEGQVRFYANSKYRFDDDGYPTILFSNAEENFPDIGLKVYGTWILQQKLLKERTAGPVQTENAKMEGTISTLKKMGKNKQKNKKDKDKPKGQQKNEKTEEEEEEKKVRRNRIIGLVVGPLIIVAIILSIIFLPKLLRGPDHDAGAHNKPNTFNGNTTGATETRTGRGRAQSTVGSITTTTKAYPPMTTAQRISILDMDVSPFEIASAILEIGITTTKSVSSKVTFELKINKKTDIIRLRCAVSSIQTITARGSKGEYLGQIRDKNLDKSTHLLTVKPPTPWEVGTVKLTIACTMSPLAMERNIFPCGQKTCAVLVNRKLNQLVPHGDYSTKHPWTIKATLPPNAFLLTNTKSNSTATPLIYQQTPALRPSELSLVVVENLVKQTSGSRVESYSASGTEREATELAGTLDKGLSSTTKTSITSSEIFSFVVIPSMESYQFSGRNVALVGTALVRSNMENKQNFVWNFIFRSVIYNKVTSADKKSSGVYEQSVLFLSTSTKSTNKELWKKHLYGIVMDSGPSDVKGLANKAIVYEDEQRYFYKHGHMAKVSTVLGMLTTIGNATSGDVSTNLHSPRNNAFSDRFFFIKSQMTLEDGQKVDVNSVISCYIDSSGTPRVHFNRGGPSRVVVQRSDVGQDERCDMHIWFVRSKKDKNKLKKEHKLLSGKDEKIEIEADFPILLSGDSPSSAYGYTVDQQEFDRFMDADVLSSYDNSSVNLFVFNAFGSAAEGHLSYGSLNSFMRIALVQKVVTVDEAVDLWMWTASLSNDDKMTSLSKKIVASVLNSTGQPSDETNVVNYMINRFEKSVAVAPYFEIEKTKNLMKSCGETCLGHTNYQLKVKCAFENDQSCVYDPNFLEIYVCLQTVLNIQQVHGTFDTLYANCKGKPCLLPTLRGLLCSKDKTKLQSRLSETLTLDMTVMDNRQVVQTIYKELAFNDVSKSLLFPFLMDNWHQIHEKYSKTPALVGDIIDSFASTINTRQQLVQLQQFVAFYGDSLSVYREFKDQIIKVEKRVTWNEKYSKKFSQLF